MVSVSEHTISGLSSTSLSLGTFQLNLRANLAAGLDMAALGPGLASPQPGEGSSLPVGSGWSSTKATAAALIQNHTRDQPLGVRCLARKEEEVGPQPLQQGLWRVCLLLSDPMGLRSLALGPTWLCPEAQETLRTSACCHSGPWPAWFLFTAPTPLVASPGTITQDSYSWTW